MSRTERTRGLGCALCAAGNRCAGAAGAFRGDGDEPARERIPPEPPGAGQLFSASPVARPRNGVSSSRGRGTIIVVVRSALISISVCR